MKAKKILCSALAGVIAAGAFSISAFADNEKQMSVTVRIEGISKNLYYNTVDIPYTGENLTVQNALMYVDQQSDDITITGVENGWITAVNDEKQASFGGWDGWLYTVNGVSPTDTVNDHMLSDGDSVVLYYGDPYGVGMQYPEIDTSKITDGILTFTSKDTSYDADYNPTVVTNPVKDAKVELGTEDGSVSYTTDENGSINIDDKYLTEGNHSISISKVSENGLPLVLRFAPDRTVAFPSKPQEPSSESSESSNESSKPESISQESTKPSESSTVSPNGKVPSTGDSSALTVVILTASAAFAVILTARKRNHEK
mgnify:CR=1 FL=1